MYSNWPKYYETKYFSNIRDQQWVPYAKNIYPGDKQKQLDFYNENQQFIENHKKVVNNIHMGYIYMFFKPQEHKTEEGVEEYATFKYNNYFPSFCT